MSTGHFPTHSQGFILLIVLLLLNSITLVSLPPAASQISTSPLQKLKLQGRLEYVFGDSADGRTATTRYFLVTVNERIELSFKIRPWHGFLKRQVVVEGANASRQGIGPAVFAVDNISLAQTEQTTAAATVTGTRNVILLLVKFFGDLQEPHPPSWYTSIINPSTGNTVNSFYLANSWGQFGWHADATNWMTLPSLRAAYANCGWGSCAKIYDLFNDAVALGAANGVNFNLYDNIAIVTNNDLDCCAYGGSMYYGGKMYGTVWEPPWSAEQGTFSHELGHSIGLEHSGWVYYSYDSPWDVMSKSHIYNPVDCGTYYSANDGTTDSISCFTPEDIIAPYKDALGWIDPAHLLTVLAGSSATLVPIDTLAAPLSASMKMIKICLAGYDCTSGGPTARYYTVEARTHYLADPGFDYYLKNEGVIIHFYQGDRPPQQPNSCFSNDQSGPAYPIDNFNVVPAPHYIGPPTCSQYVSGQLRGLYYANWNDGQTFDNGAGIQVSVSSHSVNGPVTTYFVNINQQAGTPYSASMVSNDIPTTMTPGQTYTVHVTVLNTGSNVWTAAENYKLGFAGDNPPFGPSRILLAPSASVGNGQQYTFTFTMTAPQIPATYTLRYQMIRELVTWFGQILTVRVTNGVVSVGDIGPLVMNSNPGSAWFVLPDYGGPYHTASSKCGGVNAAELSDYSAGGYVLGLLSNPQNEVLDTGSSISQVDCGNPSGIAGTIVTLAGPGVNEVVRYYEQVAGITPVYYLWDGAKNNFVVRASGQRHSLNTAPGVDYFLVETFSEGQGRRVFMLYGFSWQGTLAAGVFFSAYAYPQLSQFTNSWYIFQWSDAADGLSANSFPDSGDSYALVASSGNPPTLVPQSGTGSGTQYSGFAGIENDVFQASADSVYFVLPDYRGPYHSPSGKCGGVNAAALSDYSAGGYMLSNLVNPQNQLLDTSGVVSMSGGSCGNFTATTSTIVTVAGPGVNAAVYYYERVATTTPVYYYWDGARNSFVVRATGQKFTVPPNGTGNTSSGDDLFLLESFVDSQGRHVYAVYGFSWQGTLAAATFLNTYVRTHLSQFTNSWYIYEWNDANSGASANSFPDSGDQYSLVVTG